MFAAGAGEGLRLEVEWRNGTQTVVEGARANREYQIRQDEDARAPEREAQDESERPLFEDVSQRLGHQHSERDFGDFARQPLMSERLSRLGPGLGWVDVEGDGDPDLVVTTGTGGRLAVLRNDGGSFESVEVQEGLAELDQTGIVALPDGRGGQALLVGQASYEAQARERPFARAQGVRRASLVPTVLEIQPAAGSEPRGVVGSHLSSTGLFKAFVDAARRNDPSEIE